MSISHCKYCTEEDHLIPCELCHEWLCPHHRWGTGDLSDGYFCISGHDMDARIAQAQITPVESRYADLPQWDRLKLMVKMDPILAVTCGFVIFAAALAVGLIVIQITLAIMGQPDWPNHP